MHAADLIQECANAMAAGSTVKEMAMMVRNSAYFFPLIIFEFF
jgi:hypothetical protein